MKRNLRDKLTKIATLLIVFMSLLFPATAQTKSDVMGLWEITKVRIIDDQKNNQADEGQAMSAMDNASKSAVIREFGIYENDFFFTKGDYGEKGRDVTVSNGKIAFHLIDGTSFEVGYTLLSENKLRLTYEVKEVEGSAIVQKKYSCIYTRR